MDYIVRYYNAITGEHRHDEIIRATTLKELEERFQEMAVTISPWTGKD